MVHGDVREEAQVLEQEAERAPEFFPIYLGDGALDRAELDWLHQRRLRDIALADVILVPSDHIALTPGCSRDARPQDPGDPYAADCRRFRPGGGKAARRQLYFSVRGRDHPAQGDQVPARGLGANPPAGLAAATARPAAGQFRPALPMLDQVELLGRVSHAEMPARMAAADVFVFPSLFEGSAVVTYEALACGLPSVVTPRRARWSETGSRASWLPARRR